MFDVLFFVESLEMSGESLCDDWCDVRLTGLGTSCEFEGLIDCLISSFKLEFLRLVLGYSMRVLD